MERLSADYLVTGSGIAGLQTALLASRHGEVILLTKVTARESNTAYAQGGVAAAVGEDDSPTLHLQDTLLAGNHLGDEQRARILVGMGPREIEALLELGVPFDPGLGQEAAHSRRRILHAEGDGTGRVIAATLLDHVRRNPRIRLIERARALDLWQRDGRVLGAVIRKGRRLFLVHTRATVLATGGIGALYAYTTNPRLATGDGLAMAYRAGARLADMEFVQFHPTALARGHFSRFLVSEAVRGEGALLLTPHGERIMAHHPLLELAPRDEVARAIYFRMRERMLPHVLLDATMLGDRFPVRFPGIFRHLLRQGIDPRLRAIPVSPAAHFLSGGIETDDRGRTRIPGLYACGEAACTGVHGANRLASNSLLEGLVFGRRVAAALEDEPFVSAVPPSPPPQEAPAGVPPMAPLRRLMWEKVGLMRDAAGLGEALETLSGPLAPPALATADPAWEDYRNAATVGQLVAGAALQRTESRGGHYRSDYPLSQPDWLRHLNVQQPKDQTAS